MPIHVWAWLSRHWRELSYCCLLRGYSWRTGAGGRDICHYLYFSTLDLHQVKASPIFNEVASWFLAFSQAKANDAEAIKVLIEPKLFQRKVSDIKISLLKYCFHSTFRVTMPLYILTLQGMY